MNPKGNHSIMPSLLIDLRNLRNLRTSRIF